MNILEVNDIDLNFGLDLNVNVINPMWLENDIFVDSILNNINIDLDLTNTSDLSSKDLVYNTDQLFNDAHNEYSDLNKQDIIESWLDSYNFDILKDNLFEFEDIDSVSVNSASVVTTSSSLLSSTSTAVSTSTSTDSVLNWNRRRSLLYDKNDFVSNKTDQHNKIKTTTCVDNSPTISNDQRLFKCTVDDCNKTYYKASHLKSHMRRHSGVKPFACDWNECKWRFSRSDELARHKRSHSGIKPYSCDLCDKAFSRSDHLNKHSKVHMKKLALYGTPIITKKCNYKYLTLNKI